jgi:enoyl-CoA hydratase/carnithine racemase
MDHITVETDGPVSIITINRPAVRNAVDRLTAEELRQAFQSFEASADAKVAILTGSDGTFCAGYDLKSLSDQDMGTLYDPEGDGPMGPSRMQLSKPIIAAVEGHAVAGGLELALWCDLRVASETAIFGVYCRRWGVPLVDGGTVRLPRLVGQGRALDMILTGRAVSADEAFDWGLANRVVPEGDALNASLALAQDIARYPELCMRTDRLSTFQQWDYVLSDALKNEGRKGLAPLVQEAKSGAGRFASGKGRGGDFGDIE